MYDNVYCVAVENFNSGCKIDLSHQGKQICYFSVFNCKGWTVLGTNCSLF